MALPESKRQWLQAHPELVMVASMKRRCDGHDYHGRAVYHVTLCVEGRKPVLGVLQAPDVRHSKPFVAMNAMGKKVKACWEDIPKYRPEVQVLAIQVMPDHLHGVLLVTRQMPCHLGQVVSGFKAGVRKALTELSKAEPRTAQTASLQWEDGYHDTILRGQGQLKHMIDYVHDNPLRAWTKREHPEFFTVKRNVMIGGIEVATMGNQFLLDYPLKLVVQCSRSITEEQLTQQMSHCLAMAQAGYILVSPCISFGEKTIMKTAFEQGSRQIILLENGFSPMQKPQGRQFDACAQGRILLVAPWEHHNDCRTITREQCLALNDLANKIVEQAQ